jgi:hypothetical protein
MAERMAIRRCWLTMQDNAWKKLCDVNGYGLSRSMEG